MPDMGFLHDIVILFGFALLVISVSSRLKIPPVVGFLLTGMVVGPYGLGLVHDIEIVKVFAELGVVFLLFIIGLELSPARLKRLGRIILLGGGVQTVTTMALVVGISYGLGYSLNIAIFFSFLVTLSSTAVVLKLYSERRELETPQGEAAMGILLFQDFLIVPLLLVVPVLAGQGDTSLGDFALRFGGGLLVIALFFLVGRYLLPHFLRILVYTRIRELFVIGALFACLGMAVVTEELGFSLVLGAFLAGLMIAESDYRYQVLAETGSFRDVFNSIFFISVGMLLRLDFALENGPAILGLGFLVMLLKCGGLMAATTVLGYPWRIRLIAGLGLAQFSEFSFVLIQVGRGMLDEWTYQMAIATAVLTMVLTPLLVNAGPLLVRRIWKPDIEGAAPSEEEEPAESQVVIVGFGTNGSYLARALKNADVSYAVIEFNGRAVRQAQTAGEPIIFGDSTQREIQEKAGMHGAEIAVFAISDRGALRDSVRLARALNPEIFIIVRASRMSETEELQQCGADMVVTNELETTVKLLAVSLSHFHLPNQVVREEVRRARKEGFQLLRDLPSTLTDQVMQVLESDPSSTYRLAENHLAVGSTLKDFDLRQRTGVTVLAVCRGEETLITPAADMPLAAGDVLVMAGSHEEIDRAQKHLEEMAG